MAHKFRLDQIVRLTHPRVVPGPAGSSGVFSITRLMPADETGEFSYRIKQAGPAPAGERAVRESEIKTGPTE